MSVFGKKKESEPLESVTATVVAAPVEEAPAAAAPPAAPAPAAPRPSASRSLYPPFPEGRPARSSREPAPSPAAAPSSTLHANLSFEGELKFQGTVVIDCAFKGKVSTDDTLVIGVSAKVEADLTAGTLEVSGKVHGDIHARQTVRILPGGEVYGNIETPTISMAEGVVFEGSCTRVPPQPKATTTVVRPAAGGAGD